MLLYSHREEPQSARSRLPPNPPPPWEIRSGHGFSEVRINKGGSVKRGKPDPSYFYRKQLVTTNSLCRPAKTIRYRNNNFALQARIRSSIDRPYGSASRRPVSSQIFGYAYWPAGRSKSVKVKIGRPGHELVMTN